MSSRTLWRLGLGRRARQGAACPAQRPGRVDWTVRRRREWEEASRCGTRGRDRRLPLAPGPALGVRATAGVAGPARARTTPFRYRGADLYDEFSVVLARCPDGPRLGLAYVGEGTAMGAAVGRQTAVAQISR